ncbi:MAG: cell division protein ZapA [Lachnospiraceae bacterium]
MGKNIAEVVIGGKIVSISGDEDAAYLKEIASVINEKLGEIQNAGNYRRLSAEQKMILLGMNLADDYFREKRKAQILESEIELKDKEIYSLKHELINVQLDMEKLEKELKNSKVSKQD